MYRQFPLVETAPVRDIFTNGISSVERIAPGVRRFTFFALQHCAFDARMERAIVVRLIMADPEIKLAYRYVGRAMRIDFVAANAAGVAPRLNH